MTTDRDIFKARQAIARRLGQLSSGTFYAQVSSVDQKARTCTVEAEVLYHDVLLAAVDGEKAKGYVLFPKVDSTVLVSRIGGSNELYVAMFSQIERVEIDAEQIVLNGGQNEGLIQIEKLTQKVNAFIETFNSHVHSGVIIGVSGGSGAPAVGATGTSAAPTAVAQKLDRADYENTKIKH